MVTGGYSSDRFVAFVGAGASVLPPSHLPTWTKFNELLLRSLCEQLAEYSGSRQPTDEMLGAFLGRREKTQFFSPDFQAQLIEEEIGADYFQVWQSLETDRFGPVHAGLAELAPRGRLAAIITPNFDRLIEGALHARGVAYAVYHHVAAFEELAQADEANVAPPVVKIHGTIKDAPSLVDTLRQRVNAQIYKTCLLYCPPPGSPGFVPVCFGSRNLLNPDAGRT